MHVPATILQSKNENDMIAIWQFFSNLTSFYASSLIYDYHNLRMNISL